MGAGVHTYLYDSRVILSCSESSVNHVYKDAPLPIAHRINLTVGLKPYDEFIAVNILTLIISLCAPNVI